jgi:hypothetical protein
MLTKWGEGIRAADEDVVWEQKEGEVRSAPHPLELLAVEVYSLRLRCLN